MFDYDEDADYQVRLTEDGSSDLIYDSGVILVVESTRNTVLVGDSVGPDPSSRSVSVIRDSATEQHPNELALSGFTVINSVADALDAIEENKNLVQYSHCI